MMYARIFAFVAALFCALPPAALAQWQTPSHSVPLGKGAGKLGFGNAAPAAAGTVLMSTGVSSDPTFSQQSFPNITGTATVPQGGTGAGSFTANLPLIGNGTSAIAQGTRSGNTTSFGTTSGALTSNDCVKFDASGNLIAAGSPCSSGAPGGTILVTTTIQAAYDTCPATGGTILVPVGWTETLSANLTLNKAYCGVYFLGPARITMGGFKVLMGTSVNGVFMKTMTPYSQIDATGVDGVVFISSATSGDVFAIGNIAARTYNSVLAGVNIDLRAASAGVQAVRVSRTVYWELNNISIIAGGVGKYGIQIDGTVADFGGFGRISNPVIRNTTRGILTTGSANAIVIIGGIIDCNSNPTSQAIYRDGTGITTIGLRVINTELAFCTNGYFADGDVREDQVSFYNEGNTTDVQFTSSGRENNIRPMLEPYTVTDAGSGNLIGGASYDILPKYTYATLTARLPCNAKNLGVKVMITDGAAAGFYTAAAGGGTNRIGVTCIAAGGGPAYAWYYQ